MKIAVAGTGYVGLSIATLLSQHNQVTAVDVIPEKVDMINNRRSPIQDDYIEKYLTEKELNLTATLDGAAAYKDADYVIIAAPTNYDPLRNFFDTHHIEDVINLVLSVNPNAVMVIKSTIPVGYCRSLYLKYAQKGVKQFNLLFSPEFLRESKALYDNLYPSRIIVGYPKEISGYNEENEAIRKVTDVENPAVRASQLISSPYKTGYPTSALWSYQFAGISGEAGIEGMTTYYIEPGEDGTPTTTTSPGARSIDVLVYSGQSEPKVVMGMDNSFRWKGLSLSILMAYYGGHKMRAIPFDETFAFSYSPVASYFLDAWDAETNPNSDIPGVGRYASTALGPETGYVDRSVYNASFLKIRNIVLGYDLPNEWIRHLGMSRLGIRFQIDNPKALWTANKVNVDPETLGLRLPSSFIFGLNVNF